jgi:hypothetical protein
MFTASANTRRRPLAPGARKVSFSVTARMMCAMPGVFGVTVATAFVPLAIVIRGGAAVRPPSPAGFPPARPAPAGAPARLRTYDSRAAVRQDTEGLELR